MRLFSKAALSALSFLLACAGCSTSRPASDSRPVRCTIEDKELNPVNSRLFGQMLEKSSRGEPGPEAAVDFKSGAFPQELLSLLKEMQVPLVRFPGGDEADCSDWRDSINNAPGKPRFRPIVQSLSNGGKVNSRFGIDEFGRLKSTLGFEAIIVVNLLDGLARKGPVREAAERAAGLVAYCNAKDADAIPLSLRHWPGTRAKNGNLLPFRMEYVQLGNDIWRKDFQEEVRNALPSFNRQQLAQWYIDCIGAYIQLIRLADPEIKIVIDGSADNEIAAAIMADKTISGNIAFMSFKHYGSPPAGREQSPDWISMTAVLGSRDDLGRNIAIPSVFDFAKSAGKPAAITEWNFMPAGISSSAAPAMASALSCGAWMNGLIRSGDRCAMAAQSLLMGTSWNTAAIRIDPEGKSPPFLTPIGSVATMYASHHGTKRINLIEDEPSPLVMAAEGTSPPIAVRDMVATSSGLALYIHAVNRDPGNAVDLSVKAGTAPLTGEYQVYTLAGHPAAGSDMPHLVSAGGTFKSQSRIKIQLPPASVSVVELPFAGK